MLYKMIEAKKIKRESNVEIIPSPSDHLTENGAIVDSLDCQLLGDDQSILLAHNEGVVSGVISVKLQTGYA